MFYCRFYLFIYFFHHEIAVELCNMLGNAIPEISGHPRKMHFFGILVKSSQVYFFNSRIKYTAILHNTKLYSEIYTVTHNKFIQWRGMIPWLQRTFVLDFRLQLISVQTATTSDLTRFENVFSEPGFEHIQLSGWSVIISNIQNLDRQLPASVNLPCLCQSYNAHQCPQADTLMETRVFFIQ